MNTNIIQLNDTTYKLQGNLSFNTIGRLEEKGKHLIHFDRAITIDCETLNYCDSAGIALLIHWSKEAIQQRAKLTLVNITQQMQQLISLMGVGELWKN